MSLTTVMSTAMSGLAAAQSGLRTVSDNIANVNTAGYVRKVVDQTSLVTLGAGSGVDVIGIRRVIDKYLQNASLTAGSTAGGAAVTAELSDRAQALFGDPSTDNSFFSRLDTAFSEFGALGNDPSSGLQRSEALSSLQGFFDESSRIAASMSGLQGETDTRLRGDVDQANDLLTQIAKLNGDIKRAKVGGTDSSGSENIQAQLVNQLSSLMNFQVGEKSTGGVELRTIDGMLLAGDQAGTLSYTGSSTAAGYLSITPAQSGGQTFEAKITSGEIVGLLKMRDQAIPGAIAQLTEYVGKAANEINRVSNGYSAVPAPATLTGRNTGLDEPTVYNGFTGQTSLVFLNAAGAILNKVDINFNGPTPTMTLNAGLATGFTPANFRAILNGKLTGIGSANFTNGALSITATTGGVAIADNAADPSLKAGKGFSQFFGLNDLVKSTSFAPYDTGLASTDPNGYLSTQSITLRVSDAAGGRVRDVTVGVPPTPFTTVGDLVNSLNAGVQPSGQFSLDASGRLTYAATGSPGSSVSVLADNTARGGLGGASVSALFGIGPAELRGAAGSFQVNPAINQNPALLALAKVNTAATGTQPAIAVGDGSGGAALSQAGDATANFASVNGFGAVSMSVTRYASEFAGLLGRRAASADSQQGSADAVKTEAENRRSSFEGVNMDEELVKMTTYQQAFNASARLVQAANDMYDILIKMMG